MELVDLRGHSDESLLAEVYHQLYLPHFTTPEEQESLEQYAQRLYGPQEEEPQPEMHLVVAGENLHDPASRVLLGFLIFEFYKQSRCGLLTFMAVKADKRSKGMGRQLVDFCRRTLAPRGVQGLFGECHKPECVDKDKEPIDPEVRLKVMSSLGASLVPVPYVQPELQEGAGRSNLLLFITFALEGYQPPERIPAQVVIDFWTEFYAALGVENVRADEDYVAMCAQAQFGGEPDGFAHYPMQVVTLLDCRS